MRTQDAEKATTDWRAIREAQGYGLRHTAREARIDPAHLSRIERGLATPSLDVLKRLARALGMKQVSIRVNGDSDAA